MSEYWKSTPKYWCKHCSTYVRDTKLERQNHEATGKHQGAIKRALRDLHRGHEREDREKERARREIERLNAVVPGSGSGAASASTSGSGTAETPGRGGGREWRTGGAAGASSGGVLPEAERKRQAEQLASLGVSIPDAFRGDLAMVGDWTVTSTTLVEEKPEEDAKPEAGARGVHKRERTEEEREEEEALNGLFKKPRRWGRHSRAIDREGSADLDALLRGGLAVKKSEDEGEQPAVKEEGDVEASAKAEPGEGSVKQEEDLPPIKKEPLEDGPVPASALDASVKDEVPGIKAENPGDAAESATGAEAPAVVFKKRKPKNIRQK